MELTSRVIDRIARDFPGPRMSQVVDLLTTLRPPLHHANGDERLCGAILVVADGDLDRLIAAAADAEKDWRDVLVAAGLADDDWPRQLDQALG